MRTVHSLMMLLVSIVAAVPAAAHAADVAFFPVETTNLAPEDSIAIGELLAQSYASASRQAVLSPARTQQTLSESPTYEAAAQKLGVKEYVRITALAAGRRIVISATRYQANGGSLAQEKMIAESVEDVTVVADRMAQALYQRVDDSEVRTRHNVTLAEARPERRRWSEKVWGFKTGVHFPVAGKGAKYVNGLSLQFDSRLEMDRFFIEFAAGFIVPSRSQYNDSTSCYTNADGSNSCRNTHQRDGHLGGLTAEIGASYFLTDGNIAPYIGLGVIPRLVFANGDNTALYGYAQLGVMFPRDASLRFYVDARVAQAVLSQHLNDGTEVFPLETTVHVGFGW